MNKVDLVILAGGKGTRIKRLLTDKPKPMAKFNGKYFIEYIIQNLSRYNFENIYILTGYKSKIIFKKNGKFSGTCASQSPFLNNKNEPCSLCGKIPTEDNCDSKQLS